jgi:hypothetical protein
MMPAPSEAKPTDTPTNSWRNSVVGRHFDAVYPLAFSPFIAFTGAFIAGVISHAEFMRGMPDKGLLTAFLGVAQLAIAFEGCRELRNEWRLARQGQPPRLQLARANSFYELIGRITVPAMVVGLTTIIAMSPDKPQKAAPVITAPPASSARP